MLDWVLNTPVTIMILNSGVIRTLPDRVLNTPLLFFVNHIVLVFSLLTLNIFHTCVSVVDLEQVNVSWKCANSDQISEWYITHPAIKCSKLTIEILEQDMKYVQS